jgi:hypothetical protein
MFYVITLQNGMSVTTSHGTVPCRPGSTPEQIFQQVLKGALEENRWGRAAVLFYHAQLNQPCSEQLAAPRAASQPAH